MAQPQSSLEQGWSLAIPNNTGGLNEGLEWLGRWLEANAVVNQANDRAHLVFEEIVTNIIRYGFDDNREHKIMVGARIDGDEMALSFNDDGHAFDPREAPAVARPQSIESASVGGRGLMLVRRAAKRLDYQRTREGHNLLVVTLARN